MFQTEYNHIMGKNNYFIHQIALPQDHGSWVFILSPLFIGIFAARAFTYATFILMVAAIAIFLLRQPTAIMIKAYAGRRPRSEPPGAHLWLGVNGLIAILVLAELYRVVLASTCWSSAQCGQSFSSSHGGTNERSQVG